MKNNGSILLLTALFIAILSFCNDDGGFEAHLSQADLSASIGMFIDEPQLPQPDSALLPAFVRKILSSCRLRELIKTRPSMAAFNAGLFQPLLLQLLMCMLPFLLAIFYLPDCTVRHIRFIHRVDGKKRTRPVSDWLFL